MKGSGSEKNYIIEHKEKFEMMVRMHQSEV
jgi:hypothetical protein